MRNGVRGIMVTNPIDTCDRHDGDTILARAMGIEFKRRSGN